VYDSQANVCGLPTVVDRLAVIMEYQWIRQLNWHVHKARNDMETGRCTTQQVWCFSAKFDTFHMLSSSTIFQSQDALSSVLTAAIYLRRVTAVYAVTHPRWRSTVIERVRTRGWSQKSNIARFQYSVFADSVNRFRKRAHAVTLSTFSATYLLKLS